MILDAGELPGTASTVALARGSTRTAGSFEVLREGALGASRSPPCCGTCRPAAGAATVTPMTELGPDFFTKPVAEVDPEIAEVLVNEAARQEATLEMIASENFVPQAILDCQGSVLTNKYAEGYPGRRYYGGCEHVDVAERAGDRAREDAVRRRARERPAARRRAGQRRRVPRAARAGRPHPRHEARPRRPPLARDEDQLLRPPLRHRGLRRARGGLAPRHGRARADRRGRPAEADPRRLVRLSAPARLRALPRDRRLGGRLPRGGHGALRRARGGRGAPQPGAVRRRGLHHGAQDASAARAAA